MSIQEGNSLDTNPISLVWSEPHFQKNHLESFKNTES